MQKPRLKSPVHGTRHVFMDQNSVQTLAQGIAEYYRSNPGLKCGPDMSPAAQQFFTSHDAMHVVFGCGTSLIDEGIVKLSSIFGSTAGLSVLKGYGLHESRQIYRELMLREVILTIVSSIIVVPRTILRCFRQSSLWPWDRFDGYLPMPLEEIRREFGITVAHKGPTQ